MKLAHLHIENYKGLRDIDIPLSRFACLIGENNAGKSSVLQALSLFFSGTALAKANYFDNSRGVRIEVSFSEITDIDISRLADEHRERIRAIVNNGSLTLVRVYGFDGKSSLKYRTRLPIDSRFSDENIAQLVNKKKAGKPFVDVVVGQFPELNGVVTTTMNQSDMRIEINKLADSLPEDQKAPADADLPTGIDRSVSPMLPEPIYIPAVKDLKDDVKTSESTPFGKVLGILLKAIEPSLSEEKSLFERLNARLNRVIQPDGSEKDDRLPPVKTIEETVERFVRDSFKCVTLRIVIPPPELKTILSSALIYANDGVDGLIETKGDGLRRAIVFAVLRSYVELSKTGLIPNPAVQSPADPRYLLLFEEPELYLHPMAQQILFEALGTFSQKHPVVVTTHSPLFLGPDSTTTFIKMRKRSDATIATKPFAIAHPIDLVDANARDQFQIICYENNNIAFFSDTVVLVEGDSDYIVFPHLASTINPAWNCEQLPIRFARIGGKANIRRYKQFFSRFGTRVFVITDLDFLLGTEFPLLAPSAEFCKKRNELLLTLDTFIDANGGVREPGSEKVREAQQRGDLRALWLKARRLQLEHKAGHVGWDVVAQAVDDFFAWERYWARKDFLMNCPNEELSTQKRALIHDLRAHGICVLEKGDLEAYYPENIIGDSKPAKAQCFCNAVKTREQALTLCDGGHNGVDGTSTSEFEVIFQAIFQS